MSLNTGQSASLAQIAVHSFCDIQYIEDQDAPQNHEREADQDCINRRWLCGRWRHEHRTHYPRRVLELWQWQPEPTVLLCTNVNLPTFADYTTIGPEILDASFRRNVSDSAARYANAFRQSRCATENDIVLVDFTWRGEVESRTEAKASTEFARNLSHRRELARDKQVSTLKADGHAIGKTDAELNVQASPSGIPTTSGHTRASWSHWPGQGTLPPR